MDEAENCHRLAFMYQGRIVAEGTPHDLQVAQMHAQVLEIDCEPLDAALAILRSEGSFDEVALYGSTLHALAADAEEQRETAVRLLISKGIKVNSAEAILPSLEDVFISRLRSVDRAA
jgi:ABC-2 type transport system ATP-binding protein